MDESELREAVKAYINRELAHGLDLKQIKDLLQDSPWPKEIISEVMSVEFEEKKIQQQRKKLEDIKEKIEQRKEHMLHNKYAKKYSHFYSHVVQHIGEVQKAEREDALTSLHKENVKLQHELEKLHNRPEQHLEDQAIRLADRLVEERMRQPAVQQVVQPIVQQPVVEQTKPAEPKQEPAPAKNETKAPSPTPAQPPTQQASTAPQQTSLPQNQKIELKADKVVVQDSGSHHLSETDLSSLESRFKHMMSQAPGEAFEYRNPVVPEKLNLVEGPVGDRAQTGVPGLDPVIEGGIIRKTTTMVAGGPGTGKTTLGLQYLFNGATKYNEPGVFVTFEQTVNHVIDMGSMFNWDVEKAIKDNMLAIRELTPEQLDKMLKSGGGSFRDLIESINASRVVIDSVTAFMLLYDGEIAQRRACLDLFHDLAKWGCTTVVVAEEDHHSNNHEATVLEYEADGVIVLYNERRGDLRQRSIEIFKMRGTKHAGRVFPMKLTGQGLEVFPKEF